MADKWTAINTLWNSFGLPAYDENTVPEQIWDAKLEKMVPNQPPYITYSASIGDLDEAVYLTASIWYRSNSWAEVSQKAEEIGNLIGGGYGVGYDNGRLWITKAVPFAQRLADVSDSMIRRVILQVTGEFQ